MTHDHQMKHTQSSSPDPLARGGWVGAHWPGTLMEATGMEVIEHSAVRTVISMPIDGNRQSAGILHGVPPLHSPKRRRPSPPRFMRARQTQASKPTQWARSSTHRTSAPDVKGSSQRPRRRSTSDARPPSTLWRSGTRPTASSQLRASPTGSSCARATTDRQKQ